MERALERGRWLNQDVAPEPVRNKVHRLRQSQRGVWGGVPVHGAGGRPAAARAVGGAVAEVAAAGADPVLGCVGLVDVLAVPHEQAVAAELAEERVAAGAGRALAEGLLAALVARHAVHLVVYLQPRGSEVTWGVLHATRVAIAFLGWPHHRANSCWKPDRIYSRNKHWESFEREAVDSTEAQTSNAG